jgi:hypothetical protein
MTFRQLIRTRYATHCGGCRLPLVVGALAAWRREGGIVCLVCHHDELVHLMTTAATLPPSESSRKLLRSLGWS